MAKKPTRTLPENKSKAYERKEQDAVLRPAIGIQARCKRSLKIAATICWWSRS